ncbi:MAG: sulfatase-like hydrolase/transferase [Bacteroidota bacterium]
MIQKLTLFSPQLTLLIKRLGIILLCMQLTRIVFLIFNWANFSHIGFVDFFASLWFDSITISLLAFPFIVLSLLPFSFRERSWYQFVLKFLFHFFNIVFIALNLIDVVYFSFTQKRSTIDLLAVVGGGDDFAQQIGSFFRDFWSLLVFLLVFTLFASWLNKRIKKVKRPFSFFRDLIVFVFSLAFFIVVARGGFRLKPISPLDASTFTRVENTALILNTPFTMVKSYDKEALEEKKYFDLKTELSLFNPEQESKPQGILPNKTNVVIIILESFGNEWVGASGSKNSFTPFLDSLAKKSVYFKNGIANGKKSIEAVPSIIASIPSLVDNPYISSPYGINEIHSLASILNKEGYETGFFHGATNGSMRFDGFAAQAGFKHYFGRKEYNNDAHFDKSWGILDEYFNPWTAKKLSEFKKPFFATLFTLSSHHPYFIPKHMRGKLKKGPQQICESIHYGDYSLAKFFAEAKKQPWYKNTIFVLVADHTSSTNSEIYNQRTEMYKIPILFFDPSGKMEAKKESRVFQQLDIMPTILDLLNVKTKYYSFGKSYYNPAEPQAVTYIEGTYHYFTNKHMLTFSNEKARNLYNIQIRKKDTPDSLAYYKKEAKISERRLKAIIQRYNRDLIQNQTKINEKKNQIHH